MTLEESIGYNFRNKNLMKEAMTHTSYANEYHEKSNEKLEFMGDAILEFVSSEYMFTHFKDLNEGKLTKMRASVVDEKSLYKIAMKHKFYDFIRVGQNEIAQNGNYKTAILADSVEALIAAIYFDGGLEPAKKFIIENLKDEMENARQNIGAKDYKTVLQEKLQVNGDTNIRYEIINEIGPDHDKTFEAEVYFDDKPLAKGIGKSKKEAEMNAAKSALGE